MPTATFHCFRLGENDYGKLSVLTLRRRKEPLSRIISSGFSSLHLKKIKLSEFSILSFRTTVGNLGVLGM